MGKVQEAFPFQVGFRKLSVRIKDAGIAADVIKAGNLEYQSALREAIDNMDSLYDIKLVHSRAVIAMLTVRQDLRTKVREMHNQDVVLQDSIIVNPALAALDRIRNKVAQGVGIEVLELLSH